MSCRERELEAEMYRKLVTRRLRWFPRGITADKIDRSLRWACGALSILYLMRDDGLVIERDGLWYLRDHPRAVTQIQPPPPPPPPPRKSKAP